MQIYFAQGLVDAVYALLTDSVLVALCAHRLNKPRWSRSTLTLIIFLNLLGLHGEQD